MDSEQRIRQDFKEEKPQNEDKGEMVSLCALFRFAEGLDYLYIVLAIIFTLVVGCGLPWFAYLWGKILDSFLSTNDPQARLDNSVYYRNIFFYLGLGSLVSAWISFACWTVVSQHMTIRCRKAYMKSLLRQDIGWFDMKNQFELSQQFNVDALAFQKATGEKIGSMFYLLAIFLCGAIVAFLVRWTMALAIMGSLPVIAFVIIIFIYLIHLKNSTFLELYEKADTSSHQALSSIKTVKSLNGEPYEEQKYSGFLELLKEKVPRYAFYGGIATGLFFFIQYCAFSWGFYFGSHCVGGSHICSTTWTGSVYTPGEATIVFFAIFVGSFNFMQLVPNIIAIIDGMKAAHRLYSIIDQEPTIDRRLPGSPPGLKKADLQGHIKFENVSFAYPSKKNEKILKNLSLNIQPGQISAFVGDTGSGKSTVIQLVMRFYDPDEGKILLDGVDIKQYDLEWLRNQIGYVGQEPSLFEGSVLNNIMVGRSDSTEDDVRDALSLAQALEFVDKLPDKLHYNVGYGGALLSGGQKQRLAIARALIRQPRILILDEATSALDRRNEKLIQQTLDKIAKGRTTLTIAHRVKTIMDSDSIFVLKSGSLLESGKFNSLDRFKDLEINIKEDDQDEVRRSNAILKRQMTRKQSLKQVNELTKAKSNVQEEQKKYEGSIYGRLFEYTQGNRCKFFIAVICALVAGAVHPCSALFLANIVNEQFNIYQLSVVSTDNPLVTSGLDEIEKYVLGLFLLAVFIFFPFMLQSLLFTLVGESVTQKIRKQVYNKMLKLQVSWFQKKQNRGGLAATRFGVDSRQVNGLVTSLISTVLMNFSAIVGGLVIAFLAEWRLGLVGLIAMPCMVTSGFIAMLFYTGFGDENKAYYEQSAKLAEQGTLNIRTVYSNGYHHRLHSIYCQKLQHPMDAALCKGTKMGVLFGLAQMILQFTFGCLFYFGTLVMRDNPGVSQLNIFYAIMAIAWAGWYAGNTFYFMPDVVAGKESAKNLFMILDHEDEDQKQIRLGSALKTTPIEGKIQVRDLFFQYNPTDDVILKGISLNIQKGEKVAFVGPSGCGKSTLFQLLQRFYDYDGQIFVDGVELRDYDLHHVRQHFTGVSQEPSLFLGSIGQNIRYNTGVSDKEVEKGAQLAEATKFIKEKEEGFGSSVGVRGGQLSGGQKQRVAVARVLVRNPQILMLDEATSALDRQTEKRVQEKIDEIMRGKTSLVIAHRIETIYNSSRIHMFDRGEIIEEGSYKELVAKKKHFYNLERGAKLSH